MARSRSNTENIELSRNQILQDHTIFIQAITGSNDLKVTKIGADNDTLEIETSNAQAVQEFRNRLGSRAELLKRVLAATHPLSPNSPVIKPKSLTTTDDPLFALKGIEIFNRLLHPDFLESLDFSIMESAITMSATQGCLACKDLSDLKVLRLLFAETDEADLNATLAKIELFKTALSNPTVAASILKGTTPAIKKIAKGSKVSDFGKGIFAVYPETKKDPQDPFSAIVLFNYGHMLQQLQSLNLLGTSGMTPIIAQLTPVDQEGLSVTTTINLTVSKRRLIEYLHTTTESFFIFKQQPNGLTPVMFRPDDYKAVATTKIYCLMDISGSMNDAKDFPEYQKQTIGLLDKIADKLQNFEIEFITFNHNTNTIETSIKDGNVSTVKEFVNKQKATGKTNLCEVIYDALTKIKTAYESPTQSTPSNHVVLLFTDGKDTIHNKNAEEVQDIARKTRAQSDQFALYCLAWGNYDKELINALVNQCAFHRLDVKGVHGISTFEHCINSIDKAKAIGTVMSGGQTYKIQCAANDISVSNIHVGNDVVTQIGQEKRGLNILESQPRTGGSTSTIDYRS